jgi:hypothetical protein
LISVIWWTEMDLGWLVSVITIADPCNDQERSKDHK